MPACASTRYGYQTMPQSEAPARSATVGSEIGGFKRDEADGRDILDWVDDPAIGPAPFVAPRRRRRSPRARYRRASSGLAHAVACGRRGGGDRDPARATLP